MRFIVKGIDGVPITGYSETPEDATDRALHYLLSGWKQVSVTDTET
jgi:hypothetical protein